MSSFHPKHTQNCLSNIYVERWISSCIHRYKYQSLANVRDWPKFLQLEPHITIKTIKIRKTKTMKCKVNSPCHIFVRFYQLHNIMSSWASHDLNNEWGKQELECSATHSKFISVMDIQIDDSTQQSNLCNRNTTHRLCKLCGISSFTNTVEPLIHLFNILLN